MLLKIIFVLGLTWTSTANSNENGSLSITSPHGKIQLALKAGQEGLSYSVHFEGKKITGPNAIGLKTSTIGIGSKSKVKSTKHRRVSRTLTVTIPTKNRLVKDEFNELRVALTNGFDIILRAYDDGVAYRIQLPNAPDDITVFDETVEFLFPRNHVAYFPREKSMFTHFEQYYEKTTVSDITGMSLGILPMVVDAAPTKILITEASLRSYPGMFIKGGKPHGQLVGAFAPYPLREAVIEGPDKDQRNFKVIKGQSFIAKKKAKELLPWRVMVIAEKDTDLISTDLVYKLSPPLKLKQVDWIKPGLVAWDWWNANNIHGVNFKAGINNDTYKYYIDFAAQYDLEYVILDEGWSDTTNILKEMPNIDVEALVKYGKSKGVKLILWVLWNSLDQKMEAQGSFFCRFLS